MPSSWSFPRLGVMQAMEATVSAYLTMGISLCYLVWMLVFDQRILFYQGKN